MNFVRRIIDIPKELQSFVTASILYLMVQLELWLESVTTIDFSGVFQEFGAVLAVILTFVVKAALEKFVPEKFHSLINTLLVWLAGFFFAASFL